VLLHFLGVGSARHERLDAARKRLAELVDVLRAVVIADVL
jgi:hypothetical protein